MVSPPVERVRLGDRAVGGNEAVYFIAEAGYNHLGSLEVAIELIDQAKQVGADAIKFQTFRAEDLVLSSAEQFPRLKHAELGEREFTRLAEHAEKVGITFLSTPFDEEAVELLDSLGVQAFKVASMDLDNLPLLRTIARKGKPVILSTGMGTLAEIRTAVDAIQAEGNGQIILLHCVSEYPADEGTANLRAIETLREAFGRPVGYSDHTLGRLAAVIAAVLGASVIEKHFTTDRSRAGADNEISMGPEEFTELIRDVQAARRAMGSGEKLPTASEQEGRRNYRRGLYARMAIPRGTRIMRTMVKCVRPANTLGPGALDLILGRVARVDIAAESPLSWELLEEATG